MSEKEYKARCENLFAKNTVLLNQQKIDAEQIRALRKQNEELTDELTITNNECKEMREELKQRIRENQKLEAQIDKMKCCGNCENGELSAHEEPCRHCQRCFASADVTDQENVKDNWEAIKEIKEK